MIKYLYERPTMTRNEMPRKDFFCLNYEYSNICRVNGFIMTITV